jgi:acyl-CoA dehydrogenase
MPTMSPALASYAGAIREWSVEHVRPRAREADELHRPPADWPQVLDKCPVPIRRHDRRDLPPLPTFDEGPWVRELASTEAVCYGDIWAEDVIGSGIGHLTVKLMGTPEQVERWHRPIIEVGGRAAFALTEPHFGSDTTMVSTTAVRDGDSWVINGSKMYCSSGGDCEYVVVFASTDKALGAAGIAAFVIPFGTPGYVVAKPNEDKLGIRAWMTSELLFDNCTIPLDHRLGWDANGPVEVAGSTRTGQGGALGALSENRPNIAAMGLGIAQASLDTATALLREQQASFSVRRWSAIEDDIARMNVALERVRRVAWGAQFLLDHKLPNRTEASGAKAYGPPTFERVIRRSMLLLGPDGTSKELLLEKWYRDVKILDIFEGSAQVQRIVIGRSLLGSHSGGLRS